MLSVLIFEGFFKKISDFLDVPDASFLIIVGVEFFLLLYVLYLSIKLSDVSDKLQELISYVAILDKRHDDMTKSKCISHRANVKRIDNNIL